MENFELEECMQYDFIMIFSDKVNRFAAVLKVARLQREQFGVDGCYLDDTSVAMLTIKLDQKLLSETAQELPGEHYVMFGKFTN